ncbi:DUF6273 domain-containing protein [Cytobacillus firmus]|uniref:DUF6273 domain-containing protein n=1 Tax=Cytobacillus firmus TaxID=1399 RepID=UPI0018CD2C4E|nr:DUF6273 domain-containing protein [Cytobacillus firmus]MED1904848.1 DUF6273 domain-containing protein [Cytobacillus firmus]
MASIKVSQEVTEVLNKLVEVVSKDREVSLQLQPTEKLLNDMQSILVELKNRVSAQTTKSLHELPVGAKVLDKYSKYYGAPVVWLVADQGFYKENLTTLLSERILTFKAFDAAEPNNPVEYRSEYGNNEYKVSNIHQWLNSDKAEWFKPLHDYDQAPTEDYVYSRPYADERGFLDSFSPVFKQHLVDTQLEDLMAKVFLLSASEVGLSNKGRALKLFDDNEAFRKAKPTTECVQIDDEGSADEPDWWWLRTPHAGNSDNVRSVNSSGALSNGNAYNGSHGVRPALNLPSEIRVKAEPDANGIYEIVWS